jgi:hypothetical protein
MRTCTKEIMSSVIAGAGVAAIMFFRWRDAGLYANRGNCLNGGTRCGSFAI